MRSSRSAIEAVAEPDRWPVDQTLEHHGGDRGDDDENGEGDGDGGRLGQDGGERNESGAREREQQRKMQQINAEDSAAKRVAPCQKACCDSGLSSTPTNNATAANCGSFWNWNRFGAAAGA